MTADCQACLVGVPRIGTPAGKPDNPIGVCLNCGSLTCGEHGHRDPKPRFWCIQCDPNLQAGSAGRYAAWRAAQLSQGGGSTAGGSSSGGTRGGGARAGAARAAAALQQLLPEGWEGLVTSFEEWAERRPYYGRLIDLIRQDLDNIVRRLDLAARRYAARTDETSPHPDYRDEVADAGDAGRPGEISPTDFSALWRQLDRDGRQLLAAALVLALVMNLPAWSLPPQIQSIARIAEISFREDFPPPGQRIPVDPLRYR